MISPKNDPMTTSDLSLSDEETDFHSNSQDNTNTTGKSRSPSFGYESLGEEDEIFDDYCNPSTSKEIQSDDFSLSPFLQYFLAGVCDLRPNQDEYSHVRFGLRHAQSQEVRDLLEKIEKQDLRIDELAEIHPNAIVTVVKELLLSLPPIFAHEEFLCLPVDCSAELALCYLTTLIDGLSSEQRQLAFLASKAIARLIHVGGSTTAALTDAVILYTPCLFPLCSSRCPSFLRASRATLLLIESSESLFAPYITHDQFYTELFGRLNRLHESILSDSDDEETSEESSGDSGESCGNRSDLVNDK
ncbi:unnamed protein product, partial [Mesorhabditis belari]|uniref:Uncharacterized protein n=1 Tax=Mesorhabditis belari TaxID=2138241 RepID=A0AAF3F5D9_9BILA